MSVSDGHGGPRITRRAALARGAGGLAAAGSLSALLAACGGSSGSSGSSGHGRFGREHDGHDGPAQLSRLVWAQRVRRFLKAPSGVACQVRGQRHDRGGGHAGPDREQRRCLRPLARRGAERRAALAGQAAGTARHRQGPERQAGSGGLSHIVPMGDPDRFRQDRLRLPQGPDLRAADVVEGAVRARAQVLGQDHDAQVRHRHPGVVPEGTRVLGQHQGAEPAAGDAEADARRSNRTCRRSSRPTTRRR